MKSSIFRQREEVTHMLNKSFLTDTTLCDFVLFVALDGVLSQRLLSGVRLARFRTLVVVESELEALGTITQLLFARVVVALPDTRLTVTVSDMNRTVNMIGYTKYKNKTSI